LAHSVGAALEILRPGSPDSVWPPNKKSAMTEIKQGMRAGLALALLFTALYAIGLWLTWNGAGLCGYYVPGQGWFDNLNTRPELWHSARTVPFVASLLVLAIVFSMAIPIFPVLFIVLPAVRRVRDTYDNCVLHRAIALSILIAMLSFLVGLVMMIPFLVAPVLIDYSVGAPPQHPPLFYLIAMLKLASGASGLSAFVVFFIYGFTATASSVEHFFRDFH